MKAFFDSNVLVYALASDDRPRRLIALKLVEEHSRAGSLVLSTQVLMETYNVLTRKKRALGADARASLRLLARHEIVALGASAALNAMALAEQHKLSSWDALIIQAAIESGCNTLFSEDMQAGRRFDEVEIVNPFELKAHEPPPKLAARPRQRRR